MAAAKVPWGKLQRGFDDPSSAPRLSLVAHCIDVAAVLSALLALPTLQHRLQTLAGRPLSTVDLIRLTALAFLHDVGKAGAGFYSKGVAPAVQQRWLQQTHAGRDQLGHVSVVGPLLDGDEACQPWRDALGVDEVLAWGGNEEPGQMAVMSLWLGAISHHGTPVTLAELHGVGRHPTWACSIDGYEPLNGLAELRQSAWHLFPQAFDASAPPLTATPRLVHAFAGLVSLADWIGSNTDPAFFPYELGSQDVGRWPVALARARDVLVKMRFDVEALRADLLDRRPEFQNVFGFEPTTTQQLAARLDFGPLVVVEAETGSGKTEAALWRFKTLLEAGEVDSLCFLLPTRVAATATQQRLQRFVEKLFPDPRLRPGVVLAVPGYLRANAHDGQALAGFEVLWPDDVSPRDKPLYWAAEHSKRYFAAACAAGTIDQFLMSALQVKHAHMRGAALLRSLVVVDEVHASDAYMTALLQGALDRHVQAGGCGLLMSATLTGEARARLVQAGVPARQAERRRAALAVPDAPYPCVSDARQLLPGTPQGRPKAIERSVVPDMRNPEAVAATVAGAADHGARVLVLRNTVTQAIATQLAIERRLGSDHPALFRCKGIVAMHHGRYAFEDRQLLDLAVEAQFGAHAFDSRDARLLVGTQTLEISLDCDADGMISDVVPIDVMLQRLGRLHRHRRRDAYRPAAYATPRVVVLRPQERDLSGLLKPGAARGLGIGGRSAYGNLLAIEACLRALEDTATYPAWVIPDHNRVLVEAGADSGRLLDLAEALGGDWPAHAAEVLGKQGAQRAQAWPVMLRWDRPWQDSAWADLGEAVRTRLGLDGVDIELLRPWCSPFGSTIKQLTVPRWMLPGLAAEPVVEQQFDEGDGLSLEVAAHRLRYDRLGLRTV